MSGVERDDEDEATDAMRAYRLADPDAVSTPEPSRRPKAKILSALAAISAAHGADEESRALSRRATHAKSDEAALESDRTNVLRRAGHHALEAGDPARAEGIYRKVVEIREQVGGLSIEDLASLGTALRYLARGSESEEILRRATRMGDGPLGEETPAIVAHELGVLLVQLERVEGGRKTLERALGVATRKLPLREEVVARLLHALAICDVDAGETARGLERLRTAMEIRARLFGVDDALYGAMLATSARAQHREGHLNVAEQTYALALDSIARPHTGTLMAQALVHVAELRLATGSLDEALRLVTLALESLEVAVGEHPMLCRAGRVRARVLRRFGRVAEAEEIEVSVGRIIADWAKR
jgi:tetratricopeptide (TPR) repeat protein